MIGKLLEKDPIKRINWEELKAHHFWDAKEGFIELKFSKMKADEYPTQTQYDNYLKSRGIVPE